MKTLTDADADRLNFLQLIGIMNIMTSIDWYWMWQLKQAEMSYNSSLTSWVILRRKDTPCRILIVSVQNFLRSTVLNFDSLGHIIHIVESSFLMNERSFLRWTIESVLLNWRYSQICVLRYASAMNSKIPNWGTKGSMAASHLVTISVGCASTAGDHDISKVLFPSWSWTFCCWQQLTDLLGEVDMSLFSFCNCVPQ